MFPGKRLCPEDESLVRFHLVSPWKIMPFDISSETSCWKKIGHIHDAEFLNDHDAYLLVHDHPTHDYLRKVYACNREELIVFLKDRFEKPWGSIDVLIAPLAKDLSKFFIGTHDGDLFEFSVPASYRDKDPRFLEKFAELVSKIGKEDLSLSPVQKQMAETRYNIDLQIYKTKKMVERWHGSDVILLELTQSHRTIRVVCGLEYGKNLVISCLEPVHICAPIQWSNSCIRIERVPFDADKNGIVLIDDQNEVKITAFAFEVRENVRRIQF